MAVNYFHFTYKNVGTRYAVPTTCFQRKVCYKNRSAISMRFLNVDGGYTKHEITLTRTIYEAAEVCHFNATVRLQTSN